MIGTFAPADDPAAAPEPLLPLPRDRQRHRPLGCAGRRDGRGHRRAPPTRAADGRRRDPHRCRGRLDRHRRDHRRRSQCADGAELECAPRAARTSPRPCSPGCSGDAGAGATRARGLAAEGQHAAAAAARGCATPRVSAGDAFAGTFHVNEGYEQLDGRTREAATDGSPTFRPASCTATR